MLWRMTIASIRAPSMETQIGTVMTLQLLLTLLIVVSLCGLMAWREWLSYQERMSWMRLHSLSLNLDSLAISEPVLTSRTPRAEARRIHKLSIPIPFGGLNRD